MKHTCPATAALLLLALSSSVEPSNAFRQQSLQARSSRLGIQQMQKQKQPPAVWKQSTSTGKSTLASSPTSLEMVAPHTTPETAAKASLSLVGALRGGSLLGSATGAVTSALQSGPFGTLALAAVTSCVVIPLTMYRQIYAFTVAYALAMAAVGLVLSSKSILLFPAASPLAKSLSGALVFYGLRLGGHLLFREATVSSKRTVIKNFDKTPRLERIPFALGVGLFFAFMGTPSLYLCRAGASLTGMSATISQAGVGTAWFGAVVEAWTDTHKLWHKRGKDEAMDFTGPSTWWYGVCKHPNYFAEIVFWIGVLVSGLPSMVAPPNLTVGSGVAAVCSVLGISGILSTMLGATRRLETKQEEKYGGQIPFEEWKANTPALFPTTVSLGMVLPVSLSVGMAMVVRKAVGVVLKSSIGA